MFNIASISLRFLAVDRASVQLPSDLSKENHQLQARDESTTCSTNVQKWRQRVNLVGGNAAAEQGAGPEVRQLGQRRQRAIHALLRERAQGQGRQDDQPQRPGREPGGLLSGRAVAEPLGVGEAPRAPAQRRAAGVAQPLRRVAVAVPPPRAQGRRTLERQRRRSVQRRPVARAPVQLLVRQGRQRLLREKRIRPRRQLRRPVPRQEPRQRDADERLGGAQVRRLGLEPGVGGRVHAHLQQGAGGEAEPGGEAGGGLRQGRGARPRRQAARRRLRVLLEDEVLVLRVVQIERRAW